MVTAWSRRLPSTCADNFVIPELSRVIISLMTYRIILLSWLFLLSQSIICSSSYIFVEDTGSIGSLKGLLKENLNNDDIETLGYTPKSLNVVLNKTNQLQTSMVWILRESFESKALIISRCGQPEQNLYTDGLIKSLRNKKSKTPRLFIGWIPYKQLGQITSQCVLLEVPKTSDLASLAIELSKLFKPQTQFPDENIPKASLKKDLQISVLDKTEIQPPKQIPMQWDQFRKTVSRQISEPVSHSMQKISYDPDEDLFLTPFISASLDSKTQSDNEKLKSIENNLLIPNTNLVKITTSTNLYVGSTDSKISLESNVRSSRNSIKSSLPSIMVTSSQEKLYETSSIITTNKSVLASTIMTTSIRKNLIPTVLNLEIRPNLSSLKELYLSTDTRLLEKLDTTAPQKNTDHNSQIFSIQKLESTRLNKDDKNKKNLIKGLKTDFRQELLDKFRKERGRQSPEWLFEE